MTPAPHTAPGASPKGNRDPQAGQKWPDLLLPSGRVIYPQHQQRPMGDRLFGPADAAAMLSKLPWHAAASHFMSLAQFAVLLADDLHVEHNDNPALALHGLLWPAGLIGVQTQGHFDKYLEPGQAGRIADLETRLRACAVTAAELPVLTRDEHTALMRAHHAVTCRAWRDLMPSPRNPRHGAGGPLPRDIANASGRPIRPLGWDAAHDLFLSRWNQICVPAGRERWQEIEARLDAPPAGHNATAWWQQ